MFDAVFSAPRALHWEQALRCLGYLMSTATYGIRLGAGGPDELVTFSDRDWAGDPITRRSTGGYVVFGGILSCVGHPRHNGALLHFRLQSQNSASLHSR